MIPPGGLSQAENLSCEIFKNLFPVEISPGISFIRRKKDEAVFFFSMAHYR
jgi:hypothetical protein